MVGVATAALACRDTTAPKEASNAGITKPSFTAAAGFTPTHVHPAGTTFFENGGMVGMARNEGTVDATTVVTFFVPEGGPTRLDAPAPGNCAF